MDPSKAQEAYNTKREQQKATNESLFNDMKHVDYLKSTDRIQKAIIAGHKASIEAMTIHEPKVEVKNFPKPAKSVSTPDVKNVVKAINKLEKSLSPHNIDFKPVIEALNQLNKKIDELPKENPTIPETVSVSNLKEVSLDTTPIVKALSKIQLKSPDVKVAAPEVVVQTDLKPVIAALTNLSKRIDALQNNDLLSQILKSQDDLVSSINNLKFPVPNFVQDPLVRYKVADIDDESAVKYYGNISPEGNWYILKEDTSVSPKTYRYAYGSGSASSQYPSKWTNRATLTYDYMYVTSP